MLTSTLYALISVVVISLISLAGLVTVSMSDRRLKKSVFLFVALATGAMIGDALLHLIPEAVERSSNFTATSLLVIAGILMFFTVEKLLNWHHGHDHVVEEEEGEILPVGHMILFSDGVHNFLDGVLIGMSYLVSTNVGIATTIAILLHELPHEIGDFSILIHAGYSRMRALFYNFLSALTAILGTVSVIILGPSAEALLIWILPISAGTFLYIASSDLVPELHRETGLKSTVLQLTFIAIGVTTMYGLLFLEI